FGADLPKIAADWTFDGNGKEIWGEDQPFQKGRGSASYCCLPPPVFADNKLYLLFCFDDAIGARPHKAFLTAINPVNGLAAGKRLLWKTPDITNGTLSPQAAADGLIYLGDKNGGFHCLDAQTGQSVWKLDLKGEHWGGALIADGRIYAGTNRRMFYVLQAGREPKILSEIEMPDAVFAGASAANGTLFVAGNGFLYAVEK
ncbi:MAG: PQQ-binding-like beta-propeller repeat protein, partial [Planctomycetaceae bacterium]|nr:PQQ-binding-like beta-propeller repeat protein [Planctomycetaceae bacterium]